MKGKYFDTGWLKPITPVTNQIGTGSEDAAFADKDIVFDWTAVDVPKGTHRLLSAALRIQGTHGSRQAEVDFQLWFARPIDGVEPPSLGTPNAAVTGREYRKHMLGVMTIDATQAATDVDPFNSFQATSITSSSGTLNPSSLVVVNGERMLADNDSYSSADTPEGYHRIYIAGLTMGALNFSTNILVNETEGYSVSTSSTTLTTDGANANRVFEVGDVIQAMDLAEVGTITAVGTTSITVDAVAGALADDDEFLTTSPVKVKLAFEQ